MDKEQDYIIKTFYVLEVGSFKTNSTTYEVRTTKMSGVRLFNDIRDNLVHNGLAEGERLVTLKLMQFSARADDIKRLKITKDGVLHNIDTMRDSTFTLNKVLRYVAITGGGTNASTKPI